MTKTEAAVDRDILQGRADHKAGRGKLFNSAEELIAYLHSLHSLPKAPPR